MIDFPAEEEAALKTQLAGALGVSTAEIESIVKCPDVCPSLLASLKYFAGDESREQKALTSHELIVRLASSVDMEALAPDFGALVRRLSFFSLSVILTRCSLLGEKKPMASHGIWITSLFPSSPSTASNVAHEACTQPSYRARTFFPAIGINEDWVCGTANTVRHFFVPSTL